MAQNEREERILERLNEQEQISTREMAQLFDVAEMTIRRDFENLERKGKLERVHGGAKRIDARLGQVAPPAPEASTTDSLYLKAAALIPDGVHLFMDGSPICLELLPYLENKQLQITTNAPLTVSKVCDKHTLFFLGGTYLPNERETCGPVLFSILNDLYFDYAFISCTGVDSDHLGVFANRIDTAEVKRKVIEHSEKAILLIEPGSYGIQTYVRFATLNDFYAVLPFDAPKSFQEKIPSNFVLS